MHVATGFQLHRQPGPGVAYPNIGEFCRRQLGQLDAVLVGPRLPDGVVPVHDNHGYSAQQPCPGARGGVVLVNLLPDGAGAGHGEVFVDLLLGSSVAVHDDHGYYPWQPRPGAGRSEVFS
jgi:hypothetical protein